MTNTLQPTKQCPGCGHTTRSGYCDPCLDTPKETTVDVIITDQLKSGVITDFTYACRTCGSTVTVKDTVAQPHSCRIDLDAKAI